MSLTIFSTADFANHFSALGLRKGDDVILHSKLTSFALVPGGASSAYNGLREVVGNTATIVVPTYCFQLSEDDVYDPQATPSQNMGVISEYVRKLPNAVRSACPIHNHSAIGDKAAELSEIEGNVSFGPKSDFSWLSSHDFKLVLLGCGFIEAGTQVFHAMANIGVPYRGWHHLHRKRQNKNGYIEKVDVRYYARNSGEFENIKIPEQILSGKNQMTTVKAPAGFSHMMKLHDYRMVCDTLLKENPNSFLMDSSHE